MQKYIVITILLFSISFNIFSDASDDAEYNQQLVDEIASVLLIEYENYEKFNPMEKLILKLGRKTFFESVEIWRNNWFRIETMPMILHPRLEHMAKTGDANLSVEKAAEFRTELENLTRLAWLNLELYRTALIDYFILNECVPVSIDVIDMAVTNPHFYEQKSNMYQQETAIKDRIRSFLRGEELRYKLGTYRLAFNFFDKIRVRIIEKDMEKMRQRIKIELPNIIL